MERKHRARDATSSHKALNTSNLARLETQRMLQFGLFCHDYQASVFKDANCMT